MAGMPRRDFNNVLALTGDYPTVGFCGLSGPVFDLTLWAHYLLRTMNEGLGVDRPERQKEILPKTELFHRRGRLAFQAARAGADTPIL